MKEITDHGEDFDEFYNGNEMITVYCACGYSSLDGEIPHELTPYCSSEKELIEKEFLKSSTYILPSGYGYYVFKRGEFYTLETSTSGCLSAVCSLRDGRYESSEEMYKNLRYY